MSWPPPNYHPDHGTGYRVTFHDFQSLVSDPNYRPAIAPLLKSWFGCDIGGNQPLDFQSLHTQIQSDPEKQYYLYQRAMDLWR